MAADNELPVWSLAPNWSDPIIETLTWQSEVLTSDSGAEQGISYRLSPRRSVEARFTPAEQERAFAMLALQRLGRTEWMVPLWFDAAPVTLDAAIGADNVRCDTAYHEFVAGGMALIRNGGDAFDYEVVEITSVAADRINLLAVLGRDWPAGSTVHPMRRAWLDTPNRTMLTSRVDSINMRFDMDLGNTLSDEGTWEVEHAGTPVLSTKSEWSENIDIDLSWLGDEFDSEFGVRIKSDTAGRAFKTQKHRFVLIGAAKQYAFRQMLYRLRGQAVPLWLPSQGDDLTVTASALSGTSVIDIALAGLTYVGGPADGADYLYMPDGQVVQMTGSTLLGATEERITVGTALTSDLAADDRISFIEKCRLAQDSIEIEHLGDNDGVARATLSFRAFADTRSATTAVQDHPAAVMNSAPCGDDVPIYAGWYAVADFYLNGPEWGTTIVLLTGPDGALNSGSTIGVDFDPSDGVNGEFQGTENSGYEVHEIIPNEHYRVYWKNSLERRGWEISFQSQFASGTEVVTHFRYWYETSQRVLVTYTSLYANPGDDPDSGIGVSTVTLSSGVSLNRDYLDAKGGTAG